MAKCLENTSDESLKNEEKSDIGLKACLSEENLMGERPNTSDKTESRSGKFNKDDFRMDNASSVSKDDDKLYKEIQGLKLEMKDDKVLFNNRSSFLFRQSGSSALWTQSEENIGFLKNYCEPAEDIVHESLDNIYQTFEERYPKLGRFHKRESRKLLHAGSPQKFSRGDMKYENIAEEDDEIFSLDSECDFDINKNDGKPESIDNNNRENKSMLSLTPTHIKSDLPKKESDPGKCLEKTDIHH